jgi:outer membrane protein TolC
MPLWKTKWAPQCQRRQGKERDEPAADYRLQVLTAVREVEDGLSGLRLLAYQAAFQGQALRSARKAESTY